MGNNQSRYGVVKAWAVDTPVSDTAFRLYVRLTTYADRDGYCWPSVKTLAEASGVGERQIRRLLAELTEVGLVVREVRLRADGSYQSSLTHLPDLPSEGEPDTTGQGSRQETRGNPVPAEQGWGLAVAREPGFTGPGHEQTTRTPQRTDQRTTSLGHNVPEVEDGRMKTMGALNDDSEMPEDGASVKPKKPPFETAPKEGTHAWVVARFRAEQVDHNCGRRFTKGILDAALKDLRNDGFDNREIEIMVRAFFTRNEAEIRSKLGTLDVAQMFRMRSGQLAAQTKSQVRTKRSGGKSATEIGRALSAEADAMMREIAMGESRG